MHARLRIVWRLLVAAGVLLAAVALGGVQRGVAHDDDRVGLLEQRASHVAQALGPGDGEEAGADAVSLINTLIGMAINAKTRKPRLANIIGGLSGPAIKPVALRMVWQVAQTVSIPVIGIGGISTAEDAVEFLLAGASAVQIGTANFYDPSAAEKIVAGLEAYLQEQGEERISNLIGALDTGKN